MADDEFVAVLRLRMSASNLQAAARAAEAAADETDWAGNLDGVHDFHAEAIHVGLAEPDGGGDDG